MNCKYIITGFLLAVTLPVSAQLGEELHNFSVGVNMGMNQNNVSFTPTIKQKGLVGYSGGLTARYISEKYFSMICGVQAELNYSQRGWEELIDTNTDTYSRTMDYIELPFLAHLAFGKMHGTQFFINMGPQIAFLLNEKEHKSAQWNPDERPNNVDNKEYGMMADKNFDYGLLGGAGLEIKTGIGNFLLEGRYYFGLADFYNSTKTDVFEKSAHTTVSVRFSYLFDITK